MIYDNNRHYTLATLYQRYQNAEQTRKEDPDFTEFKFRKGYLPKLEITNNGVWIKTVDKVLDYLHDEVIRFIPIDKDGNSYDELTPLEQLLPGSLIIRVYCGGKTLMPDNLMIDYIIDAEDIMLDQIVTSDTLIETRVKSLYIDNGVIDRVSKPQIQIDNWFAHFDQKKNEIFEEYFKYIIF